MRTPQPWTINFGWYGADDSVPLCPRSHCSRDSQGYNEDSQLKQMQHWHTNVWSRGT